MKNRLPPFNINGGITLSARLKGLEKEAIIKRRVDARKFPVKVEYRLTRKGEDLMSIIKGMKLWGLEWAVRNEYCESVECEDCDI